MILCIDSGNSRIKWGLCDNGCWRESGAMRQGETQALGELTQRLNPAKVIFANVAGASAAAAIEHALLPWQDRLQVARSTAQAGGVRNHYENPQQLGVDRWSALLGARALTQTACLVVMAGTATTIDTLDADGNFLGGLILPGLDLMRRALARDTAALPLASGQHAQYPKNTGDAIVAGCLEAQAGAIERAFARLAEHAAAQCLISGGAGAAISPFLNIPHQKIEHLVLQGLYRLAGPA
jgi:type III pantothenate kinase